MAIRRLAVSSSAPDPHSDSELSAVSHQLYPVIAVLLALGMGLVLFRASHFDWSPFYGLQLASAVLGFAVSVAAHKLPRAVAATVIIGALLSCGGLGVLHSGLSPSSIAAFVLVPLVAASVLRPFQMFLVLCGSTTVLVLLALAFVTDRAPPIAMQANASLHMPKIWIANLLALLMVQLSTLLLMVRLRQKWAVLRNKHHDRQSRLTALVEHAPEGIAIMDATTGHFTHLNPAANRLLGLTPDSPYQSLKLLDFCPENQSDGRRSDLVLDEAIQSSLAGTHPKLDWRLISPGGASIRVELSLARLPSEQTPLIRVGMTDMTELFRAYREIRQSSLTDTLTGLPNRHALTLRLEEAFRQRAGSEDELALIVIDLDRLKRINDRMGHFTGDVVIAQSATRFKRLLPIGGFLARTAGDEFVILLRGADVTDQAQRLAQQAHEIMANPFHLASGAVHMSVSVGLAFATQVAPTSGALLSAAEHALHHAKTRGGEQITVFSADIGQQAHDRNSLMLDLATDLNKGALAVHYQPIVDLTTGRVSKVEALARWTHTSLGPIAPSRFIPIAEEAGLIGQLGHHIRAQSCLDLPDMLRHFDDPFQISVNISPVELTGGLETTLISWDDLTEAPIGQPPQLVFEITESALLGSDPELVASLDTLRSQGAKLALDDFGAGHSSLTYFLDHSFDYIKLDRAFVQRLDSAPRAHAICETIFHFADRLGGSAIAEGIETPEQLSRIRALGCRYGQGYFFSPPLPKDRLLELPPYLPLPDLHPA